MREFAYNTKRPEDEKLELSFPATLESVVHPIEFIKRSLVACDAATGARGAVILRGVCDEIREVLAVTGFDTVLTIE